MQECIRQVTGCCLAGAGEAALRGPTDAQGDAAVTAEATHQGSSQAAHQGSSQAQTLFGPEVTTAPSEVRQKKVARKSLGAAVPGLATVPEGEPAASESHPGAMPAAADEALTASQALVSQASAKTKGLPSGKGVISDCPMVAPPSPL